MCLITTINLRDILVIFLKIHKEIEARKFTQAYMGIK